MSGLILVGASTISTRVRPAEADGGDSTTDQFTPSAGKRVSQKTPKSFWKKAKTERSVLIEMTYGISKSQSVHLGFKMAF